MLKVTIDKIVDKLTEYGLGLHNDYQTEDQGHCFMAKGMIIFLDNDDDSLAVTFQADSKPEDVAANLLILHEIDEITDISVMESFIYDKDNKFISGNEAHEIVKGNIVLNAFQKVAKHQAYAEILRSAKGYEC